MGTYLYYSLKIHFGVRNFLICEYTDELQRIDLQADELFHHLKPPTSRAAPTTDREAPSDIAIPIPEGEENGPISSVRFETFADLQMNSLDLAIVGHGIDTVKRDRGHLHSVRNIVKNSVSFSESEEDMHSDSENDDGEPDDIDCIPEELKFIRHPDVSRGSWRKIMEDDHIHIYKATREGLDDQRYNLVRYDLAFYFRISSFLYEGRIGAIVTINDATGVATCYWKFPEKRKLYQVERRRAISSLSGFNQVHLLRGSRSALVARHGVRRVVEILVLVHAFAEGCVSPA